MVKSRACNIAVSKSALELASNKQTTDTSIQPLRSHDLKANHFTKGVLRRSSRLSTVAIQTKTSSQLAKSTVDLTTSLPTYNHLAVAEQPFLVVSGTSSERTIAIGDAAMLAKLPFRDAAARFVESRKPFLRESSFKMMEHHIGILNRYLGDLKLEKIHISHLSDYQMARMENRGGTWKKNAGPAIINHELSVVQQVMK